MVEPAGGVGVEFAAGFGQAGADALPGGQFAVKALDQQFGGLDVNGVAEGHHAAHPAFQQRRGYRAKDGLIGQIAAAAGFQQGQGDV